MTLALRLRQAGHQVTLIEAAPALGGLASAWTIDNPKGGSEAVWDRHYHVILLSDSRLRALLEEIGLDDELRWRQTRTGFYSGGSFHSLSSTLEFLTFAPLNPLERLRLGATIFHASRIRDWRPLDRELAGDWLLRWSGRGVYEKVWLPLLAAKLGDGHAKASAAFIWATVARMYSARRSGLKKEMFGYVEGGYARILGRFTEVLADAGVELRLATAVRRVHGAGDGDGDGDGAAGVEVGFADGSRSSFDRVVATVPAPTVLELCPDLDDAEVERLRGVEYLGIVCASVLLERPLTPYYITNITDPGLPFTAVIEMTALVDPSRFGGRSLVYLPRYAAPGDAIFERSDDEIEREFVAGLRRMHPGLSAGEIAAFQVSRVRHVFALPTVGYAERLPSIETSIPGLYVVHSAQIVNGTLNVNETIGLAERALPVLLADVAGDTHGR